MLNPVIIETTCPFCGQTHEVTVDEFDYTLWESGFEKAQDAFPYLSASDRELLISGICSDCWERTFG